MFGPLPFVSFPLIYCVIEGKASSFRAAVCPPSPLSSQKTAPLSNAGVRAFICLFPRFHRWENSSKTLQAKWLVRKPFGVISNLCEPQNMVALSNIALGSGGYNSQTSSSINTEFPGPGGRSEEWQPMSIELSQFPKIQPVYI